MTKTTSTRRPPAKPSSSRAKKITLGEHLSLLETYYKPELAQMPWASEEDRWSEFLFCLLYEASGQADAAKARAAVMTLRYLGLDSVESLRAIAAGDEDSPDGGGPEAAIAEILKRHGFDDPQRAVGMLAQAASRVDKEWGQLQVFLYNHAQTMIDELAQAVGAEVPEETVRAAGALWLQNTLNMPVMVERPAIAALRRRYGASVEDLMDAADKVGLNLAILDDLVNLADGDEEFDTWFAEAVSSNGNLPPR